MFPAAAAALAVLVDFDPQSIARIVIEVLAEIVALSVSFALAAIDAPTTSSVLAVNGALVE